MPFSASLFSFAPIYACIKSSYFRSCSREARSILEKQPRDSREGLLQFMKELEARRTRQQPPQVTVKIQQNNTTATPENQETVIEAASPSAPDPAIPPYSSQVLPGGKLPDDFLQAIGHQPVQHTQLEQRFVSRVRQYDDGDGDPYS